MCAQEDEVYVLKEELKEARQRLSAMEKELRAAQPTLPSERRSDTSRLSQKKGAP
jgi:hypothetical protein